MTIDVRVLDIDDAGHLAAALTVRAEMAAESHPHGPVATAPSVRRQLVGSDVMGRHSLLAFVDDEPVGLLRMMFWDIEGSRDLAVCNLEVRPAHRRRGIATALLRVGLDHCVEQQKPTIIGTGLLSAEIQGFWGGRLGLECGLVERESQLVLDDVDPALMQRWVERRSERASDYRLEHVRGPFPPELRDVVAELNTAMNDAPDDDLDVDDEVWTLSENWTGCDSYIFVTHWDDSEGDTLWSSDGNDLLTAAPSNAHIFFVSMASAKPDRRRKVEEMRDSLTLGAKRKDRVHFVTDRLDKIDGSVGAMVSDYMDYQPQSGEDLGDRGERVSIQRVEDHLLVNSVQELRLKVIFEDIHLSRLEFLVFHRS